MKENFAIYSISTTAIRMGLMVTTAITGYNIGLFFNPGSVWTGYICAVFFAAMIDLSLDASFGNTLQKAKNKKPVKASFVITGILAVISGTFTFVSSSFIGDSGKDEIKAEQHTEMIVQQQEIKSGAAKPFQEQIQKDESRIKELKKEKKALIDSQDDWLKDITNKGLLFSARYDGGNYKTIHALRAEIKRIDDGVEDLQYNINSNNRALRNIMTDKTGLESVNQSVLTHNESEEKKANLVASFVKIADPITVVMLLLSLWRMVVMIEEDEDGRIEIKESTLWTFIEDFRSDAISNYAGGLFGVLKPLNKFFALSLVGWGARLEQENQKKEEKIKEMVSNSAPNTTPISHAIDELEYRKRTGRLLAEKNKRIAELEKQLNSGYTRTYRAKGERGRKAKGERAKGSAPKWVEKAKALKAKGRSYPEIAKAVNRSVSTVWNQLNKR